MKISFVMPALNEEEGIGDTIDSMPIKQLNRQGYETEIVVIDGGSTDRTVEIARQRGAKVVVYQKGYGKQHKKGFEIATGDIIVTGDSDGSYPFEATPQLIQALLDKKVDFVNTNRFTRLEEGAMSIQHHFGNNVLTFVTNLLFGINLKDAQSGMWVFRKTILKDLELLSDGMPLTEEIKIEAFKKSKYIEVPITYRKRIGKVKINTITDGFKMLFFLFYKRLIFKEKRR